MRRPRDWNQYLVCGNDRVGDATKNQNAISTRSSPQIDARRYRRDDGDNGEEHDKGAVVPTREQLLEYLQLRQRLKESIRMHRKTKETTGSGAHPNNNNNNKSLRLPCDDYGSFFGPSEPVISIRVIQESKLMSASNTSINKNNFGSKTALVKPVARMNPAKVIKDEVGVQAQKRRRDARDYSFLLSEDAELPSASQKKFGSYSADRQGGQVTSVKQLPSRMPVSKQPVQPRRGYKEPSVLVKKQPSASSKSQMNRPPVKQEYRPKKKPARGYSDDASYEEISMMDKQLWYNLNKYGSRDYDCFYEYDYDDDDDSDMEVGFHDIMREEKRSENIARKEDEEELLKIKEEETRARERKRKMSQRQR